MEATKVVSYDTTAQEVGTMVITKEIIEMYSNGGYRERYALQEGRRTTVYIDGHRCIKFTYSDNIEYQDGNGAIYDTVLKSWIN